MTPHTVTASHPARRIPGESGTWVFLFGDMLVFGAFFVTFLVERAKEPDVFDAARTTLHLGAHLDAPSHCAADAPGIDAMELGTCYGDCQVVAVAKRSGRIRPGDLDVPVEAPRVLFRTGSFPDPERWTPDFASLSAELIESLHAQGVRLVGIDAPELKQQGFDRQGNAFPIGATSRDFLHELWKEKLWENMLKLIVAGSLLSLVVNFALAQAGWGAPWEIVQNIAIASTIAFFCAGLADTLAYQLLGEQERMLRINGSNVASGFVDSLIFPTLAFGILAGASVGDAILWNVTAQMTAAKIIGGFLWAFGIVELAKRFGFED